MKPYDKALQAIRIARRDEHKVSAAVTARRLIEASQYAAAATERLPNTYEHRAACRLLKDALTGVVVRLINHGVVQWDPVDAWELQHRDHVGL